MLFLTSLLVLNFILISLFKSASQFLRPCPPDALAVFLTCLLGNSTPACTSSWQQGEAGEG